MESARDLERKYNKSISVDSNAVFKPDIYTVYDTNNKLNKSILNELNDLKNQPGIVIIDAFDKLLLELFLSIHPEYKSDETNFYKYYKKFEDEYINGLDKGLVGSWVYYPNHKKLIHILDENNYYKVRTSRNIGLFTEDEQNVVGELSVAVAGLSVGGVSAQVLAMEGVKKFYLTDFDELACSNLNRLPSSIMELGENKTDIVASKIWGLDPYSNIQTNINGFSSETADELFTANGGVDVVIDAMDSMEAKILIREQARKYKKPIVWMIDMGDGVVQIGVERYDLDQSYKMFHGHLEKMEQKLARKLSYVESCFSIFHHDHLPFRMAESFMAACEGRGAGISQLSNTVSIAAGVIAKIVRKVYLGDDVNNEFFINIDKYADKDFMNKREKDKNKTYQFMRNLGLKD